MAGTGAAALFVVLFLDWFRIGTGESRSRDGALLNTLNVYVSGAVHTTGWSALGWGVIVLLALAMAGALALVLLTARARPVSRPVAASVLTVVIGGLAALVLLVRLVTQPGLGVGLPNPLVEVKAVAWLGFLFALAIPLGAWLALADERTDAPESAYTPPPPRPIPPPA